MTLHSYGVEKDNDTAIEYFELAMSSGVAEACTQLAVMYLNGWSVKQNIPEALKYGSKLNLIRRGGC